MVELRGWKELDRKLHAVGEDVARTIMADAVKAGSTIIRDEARLRVPVKTGLVRRLIRVRIRKLVSKAVEALIGTTRKAWYARIIEFGSAPHEITVGKAALGAIPKRGLADVTRGIFFGKKVQHPGTAPRPFLRPALAAKGKEALETMGRVLMERLTQAHAIRG